MADMPIVAIDVPYRRDADVCKQKFLDSVEKSTGDGLLVSVVPLSEDSVLDYSHVFFKDGEWVGDVE